MTTISFLRPLAFALPHWNVPAVCIYPYPIIHQLEYIYSHTTKACSTVMTYATSTPMNAPRKYNTIKTDAPDYLLAILSYYSSKFDGSCLVCLPSIAILRTSHVHAPTG